MAFQYTSPTAVTSNLTLTLAQLDSSTGVFDSAALGAVGFFPGFNGYDVLGVTTSPDVRLISTFRLERSRHKGCIADSTFSPVL